MCPAAQQLDGGAKPGEAGADDQEADPLGCEAGESGVLAAVTGGSRLAG